MSYAQYAELISQLESDFNMGLLSRDDLKSRLMDLYEKVDSIDGIVLPL